MRLYAAWEYISILIASCRRRRRCDRVAEIKAVVSVTQCKLLSFSTIYGLNKTSDRMHAWEARVYTESPPLFALASSKASSHAMTGRTSAEHVMCMQLQFACEYVHLLEMRSPVREAV